METGIQKTNNEIILSENQLIKSALTSTIIKNCTPIELLGKVSANVDKGMFYLGLNTSEADRDMIKIMAVDDIKKHFPLLGKDELDIALESGYKGKYGKVVGLAPKDIFEWLTAYSVSEQRKTEWLELQKENDITSEPTEEEKEKVSFENMCNAWESYKRDGYFKDYGNTVYSRLDRLGKINFTTDQKKDFLRLAKSDLNKELNPLQHAGNFVKVSECRALLEQINASDDNARLIAQAKRVALNHMFAEMVEMGVEILDLFIEE